MKNQYYSEFGQMNAQLDASVSAATARETARAKAMLDNKDQVDPKTGEQIGGAISDALSDKKWGTDTQTPAYQAQRAGERASY